MENFIPMKITIRLEHCEAILPHNPMDGVLARLYFDKQKNDGVFNGNYSQQLPFLKISDGIYHTSNPIYKVDFIENHFLTKQFDNELFRVLDGEKAEQIAASIEKKPGSGRYKNWIESYEIQSIHEIKYFINGNFEEITNLLKELKFIGKKASIGYGKVDSISIQEIKNDFSLLKDGNAMRPLPHIEKYKDINDKAKALYNLTHPYWQRGSEQICIMPQRRYL